MQYCKIEKAALAAGFHHPAPLDVSTVTLREQVRRMCAQGCKQYGKRWCCPPGCGTLEQCDARIHRYSQGILVQTVGALEDAFDFEGMQVLENTHKANFSALVKHLSGSMADLLPLGAGCCTLCESCTYPDAPCRFPDKQQISMEACGILVHEVCKANGLVYNYGPGTISFTACILFN